MNRRLFLNLAAGTLSASLYPSLLHAQSRNLITRPIPNSGQQLPVIGMGTWLTFDVGNDTNLRNMRQQVLQTFFAHGGALIDSSPMYGSAEEVVGALLPNITNRSALFSATKVWTPGRWLGEKQMAHSFKVWGLERFDLMQIHNMLDWETHIETIKAWKAQGRFRYIGITTSHGRRHEALESALKSQPFDFVQFTYNLAHRDVEERLLPLAAERGIAVIINRPFDGGDLFRPVRGKPLPAWAAEFDCANWAQFFLKFIVSHPAVTCAIPATTRVDHMTENMGAALGRLPDKQTRQRMVGLFDAL